MYDGALNGKTFLYKKFITECNNDRERRAFCFCKITDSDIPDADKYGQCATESYGSTTVGVLKNALTISRKRPVYVLKPTVKRYKEEMRVRQYKFGYLRFDRIRRTA